MTQTNSATFRNRIYNSITETVGATPLVRLHSFEKIQSQSANFSKTRVFNPLASVKDRIALNMIEVAEAQNKIIPRQNFTD